MASPFCLLHIFLAFFIVFVFVPTSQSLLSPNYYQKTCPDFPNILRDTVQTKQSQQPTTAAGTLRLFFQDCFLNGCDASVLVATNSFNSAERDGDINHSLPGDAFDVVTRAKTNLELACPGVVSCADILAQAARDLIVSVGGPNYNVQMGRKDGLTSTSKDAEKNIPMSNMTFNEIMRIFEAKGFTVQEMVALSGAHTIGFSHCVAFKDRLFSYSKTTPTDPEMNRKFAAALKNMCKNYTTDPNIAAFNDVVTPTKFDNMYFKNLQRGLGLLQTDHNLVKDPRSKPFVDLYAKNEALFFQDFGRAMEKLGTLDVKGEGEGEVRRRCDQFNSIQT